jgi:hypothetical protein
MTMTIAMKTVTTTIIIITDTNIATQMLIRLAPHSSL